ncbi:MAG TPA: hypothetical protein VI356_16300 [Myxococcales bacterium]
MPRPWTVLPHRPVEKLQENLWTVEANLPRGPMKRRMGIARLGTGELVFLNAIALDEPAMRELEAWGRPAFVVAANGFHRIDLGSYKQRYPQLRVLAAPAARKRIAEVVPVDGWLELLPRDPGLVIEPVAGTKLGDVVCMARAASRVSLCFPGDVLTNMTPMAGVGGLVASALGFTGELRVPRLIRWIGVRDRRALAAHLMKLADTEGLQHVFTCHGPVVSVDPMGALRRAAEAL